MFCIVWFLVAGFLHVFQNICNNAGWVFSSDNKITDNTGTRFGNKIWRWNGCNDACSLGNSWKRWRPIRVTFSSFFWVNISSLLLQSHHLTCVFSCRYVNGINTILKNSIPVLGTLLSPIYFQFFLDKVNFINTVFVCHMLIQFFIFVLAEYFLAQVSLTDA